MYEYLSVEVLKGKTLKSVNHVSDGEGDAIYFETVDGERYKMFHMQDCCESVYVEDVGGNLEDLVDSPILEAEETTDTGTGEYGDTYTWTFYKLGTIKGHVNIRWNGSSNGYYSERVDFVRIE